MRAALLWPGRDDPLYQPTANPIYQLIKLPSFRTNALSNTNVAPFVLSIYHPIDLGLCRATYQFSDIHQSTYVYTALSPFRSINPLSLTRPPIYRPMNLRVRKPPFYRGLNSPRYRHSALKPYEPEPPPPIGIAGMGVSSCIPA